MTHLEIGEVEDSIMERGFIQEPDPEELPHCRVRHITANTHTGRRKIPTQLCNLSNKMASGWCKRQQLNLVKQEWYIHQRLQA